MSQQGSISQNDLMHKLVQAKKVMNKVDSGNYERGNVDESLLRSASEDVVNNEEYQPTKQATRPMGVPSVDRINQSKLPDNIKRAMIENPMCPCMAQIG
jgi:hypothetical protein